MNALERRGQQQHAERRRAAGRLVLTAGARLARHRRIPSRPDGRLLKRLAASGAAYQASSLRRRLAGPVHAAALHAPPDPGRARLRRDAADARSSCRASCCASGIGEAFVRFWFDDDGRRAPGAGSRARRRRSCSSTTTAARLVARRARRAAEPRCCSASSDATLVASASSGCGRSRTSRSPTRCCASRSAAARTSSRR